MIKKIEWTTRAKASLDYYCSIIAKDSPTNAQKVRKEIVLTSKKLLMNPYLYQVDEYYPNNTGNIRRFFKWSYRIVYQIQEEKVVVLNVYHTRTSPNQKG
ncbi:MAG: type II toxin-antitoxin system RelE/ParE family toxin [Cyclobacteriaceae bacterium]|jgi:plasmid stabilization system protein ParE|nr:type II toxin-antitoxin system RelE/ParE family toxin [Cyclobacteriaceae bacterium]